MSDTLPTEAVIKLLRDHLAQSRKDILAYPATSLRYEGEVSAFEISLFHLGDPEVIQGFAERARAYDERREPYMPEAAPEYDYREQETLIDAGRVQP